MTVALNLSARRAGTLIVPFTRTFAFAPLPIPTGKEPNEHSQGLVTDPNSKHKRDVMAQAARAGQLARSPLNQAIDMASPNPMPKPPNMGSGNPEQVGFVEQVGSASGTVLYFASLENEVSGKKVVF
ncbi:hypothetical protein BDQ17DRAFT_1342028 [Cyathus striatus]|nr:hypothetical protein BDQ17DRAFT_1342028 [Cyathus striatus]